jgi:hypothetical protein
MPWAGIRDFRLLPQSCMKLLLTIFMCCLSLAALADQEPPRQAPPPIGGNGLAVDKLGATAVDPTMAVRELVIAAGRRLDDLREASDKLNNERAAHIKELVELRSAHEKELRVADAGRSEAIRGVDREDVSKTAASAQRAIEALAKQTTDLANTLQKTLQDTAVAVEQRQSAYATDVNKRLSALELTSSERQGKQGVSDPMMTEIAGEVRAMREAQSAGAGKTEGISSVGGVAITIAIIVTALIALYGAWVSRKNGKYMREAK